MTFIRTWVVCRQCLTVEVLGCCNQEIVTDDYIEKLCTFIPLPLDRHKEIEKMRWDQVHLPEFVLIFQGHVIVGLSRDTALTPGVEVLEERATTWPVSLVVTTATQRIPTSVENRDLVSPRLQDSFWNSDWEPGLGPGIQSLSGAWS